MNQRSGARRSLFPITGLLFVTMTALPSLSHQQAVPPRRPTVSVDALLSAGTALYDKGQLDAAIARLREAHGLRPDDPRVALYLGMFLYEKENESSEAQRLMESAATAFPANEDLHLRLLDSYVRSRNQAKIDPLLARLHPLMRNDPRFAFNVVYTLVRGGYASAAKSELSDLSSSLQGEIAFITGLIEIGAENPGEALKHFQNASKLGFPPPDSRQSLTMADYLYRLGDFPAAARTLEAYLQRHPEDPGPYRFRLALCYFGYGDFNRALEELRKVLKVAPDTKEVNYYIGTILTELKKPDDARPFFEAELRLDPRSFKSMTKIAYLEYLRGDDSACLRWLDQSRSLEPRWFETHMTLGLLQMRHEDYEGAIRSFEACLAAEPDYPKAHFQLSQAYGRTGNAEKAKQYLDSFNRLQEAAVARAREAQGMTGKK